MLTYHQVKGIMDKVGELFVMLDEQRTCAERLIGIADSIRAMHDDLDVKRRYVDDEIESVEALQQLVQEYLDGRYGEPDRSDKGGAAAAADEVVTCSCHTKQTNRHH